MDTSPEYIKMCAEALEIQQLKSLDATDGSFYFDETNKKVFVSGGTGEWCPWYDDHEVVWLPRLDQLIKMMPSENAFIGAIYWLQESGIPTRQAICDYDYWESLSDQSLEKLTLGMVMANNHQKVWTGKAWEAVHEGAK